MNRARPLTVDVVLDVDGGSSRMETAAIFFFFFFLDCNVCKRFHHLESMGGQSMSKIRANLQSPFSPDPLKIASLPVSSISLMIFDGGSVPFILTICKSSENEVSWMPRRIWWKLAFAG